MTLQTGTPVKVRVDNKVRGGFVYQAEPDPINPSGPFITYPTLNPSTGVTSWATTDQFAEDIALANNGTWTPVVIDVAVSATATFEV